MPTVGQSHAIAEIAQTASDQGITQSDSQFQALLVERSLGTAIALFGFVSDVTKQQEVGSWKPFALADSP